MTWCEYLASKHDDQEAEDKSYQVEFYERWRQGLPELSKRPDRPWQVVDVRWMRERFKINRNASVGSEIICPSCEREFIKRTYQNVFCGTRGKGKNSLKGRLCKDAYYNTVQPNRRKSRR